TWRCPQGHSFDVAKQGYVNLLPVQNKRSRDPGDSKAMMVARQEFLAAGFYQPIADAVAGAVLSGAYASAALSCLDAGCGEGYYLRQLAARSGAAHGSASQVLNLLGLDISKWAVQAAARQDKQVSWVVGNNANLPVLPGTLDRVLCMFGFPVYPEFLRVLKPGGKLLMVDAGADHLRELREIIYPTLKAARPPQTQPPAGFTQGETQQLSFAVHLPDAQQIQNLLIMTPHLYRASAEGRARAERLTELTVTVDVRLSTLVKMRCDAEPNQQ
ncbi:MAG TPA: rRNA (guanine-N1)-methyltransferase, partial [Pseudohongiella sp.]|nr:rRNA (guanine-N1)-methyltransferase [Pseudohongiella sp.]